MTFNRNDITTKVPLCGIIRRASFVHKPPGLECAGLSEVTEEESEALFESLTRTVVTILVRRTRGGLQQILEVFDSQDKATKYIKDHFFDLWPEPLEICQFCCCEERIEDVRYAHMKKDIKSLEFLLGVPLSFFFSFVIRELK